jgi:L-malate glycosyltransferase
VAATKPHICHLLHALHVGGAEVLAARLARQLSAAYDFSFVCLDELGSLGEELRAEGFPVHVLGRKAGLDWSCPWRLAKLLRRHGVDLVHAHNYTPFLYALAAHCLYRRSPVLFTEHGRHYPDYPRRKRIMANRLLLRRGDRIVGVGEAVRQALIQNEGMAAGRVQVIYNGIDLTPFADGQASRLQARQAMGVGPNDLVLMQVARLDYLKDHATAIRTLARVIERCPEARLVLVGEGPQLGPIQELCRQHRVAPNVHMLGLRKDVGWLLSGADLFLLTSISEGIPLTVIEAMAAGLPVVATQVGGIPEVVEDNKTGLLADSGDDTALAERILRLARDPALRHQLGALGRARALAMFSERQMHAQYARSYQEMLVA